MSVLQLPDKWVVSPDGLIKPKGVQDNFDTIVREWKSLVFYGGAGPVGPAGPAGAAGATGATGPPGPALTKTAVASETIANGALVNLFNSAGTLKVRNADATVALPGQPADGFVLVGGTVGNTLTIQFEGDNTAVSGLTIGTPYFLSDSTPGAYTATAPTTVGHLVQPVGIAITATNIAIDIDPSPYFV